jgi:MFS family permease
MDNSKAMRGYALGTALVISLTVSLIAVIPNLVYLIPMVALAGIGFGVINILSSVLVAQSTSAKARGLATGIGSSMRYLAFSLGPLAFAQSLTGLGESQSGYMLSFAFLALPTMAAMVLLLVAGSLMSKKTPAQNAVV